MRQRVLPVLEQELGPGIAAALARTADQLREDSEGLDEIARRIHARVVTQGAVDCGFLAGLPRRRAAAGGADGRRRGGLPAVGAVPGPRARARRPGGGHEGAVRHKQIQLPGHVTAFREGDLLKFRPTAVGG